MSTFHHTELTPKQQSAAIHHVNSFLGVEPDVLIKMQLSYLEMLVYYFRVPENERLNIRDGDSVFNDTMNVCSLLMGVHEAREGE